jgi:small subunit ribosomal protein S4
MGFAVTRAQARQLVAHKAVTVNGKKVNVPSYHVRPGDEVSLTEKARTQLRVQEAATVFDTMDLRPSWVEVDSKKFAGTFKAVPDRGDLPADINEALIVELYSK